MPALSIGFAAAATGLTFKQLLPSCAENGVTALELDARQHFRPADFGPSALRHLRKLLDDHLLRVANVDYPTRRGFTTENELEARVAGVKAALKFSADLGTRLLTTTIGLIPDDLDSPEGTLLVQVMTDLCLHSQRVGARLCVTTGPQPAASLAALTQRLPSETLGYALHPGALLIAGHDPLAYLNQLGAPDLVYATDARRGFGVSRGEPVALGDGDVDWPELLGNLQERDFRGYYILNETVGSDPWAELLRGRAYLQRL